MVVKATVTYKNGRTETVYAGDFDELFKGLEGLAIKEIDAHVISVHDIRQGRQLSRPI